MSLSGQTNKCVPGPLKGLLLLCLSPEAVRPTPSQLLQHHALQYVQLGVDETTPASILQHLLRLEEKVCDDISPEELSMALRSIGTYRAGSRRHKVSFTPSDMGAVAQAMQLMPGAVENAFQPEATKGNSSL